MSKGSGFSQTCVLLTASLSPASYLVTLTLVSLKAIMPAFRGLVWWRINM